MASAPDTGGQQSRPVLLGLLRTRSKSRGHKRGTSTPEPPSPNPALLPASSTRGRRRGGQSIDGDAGWTSSILRQRPNAFGDISGRRPSQRIRLVPHLDTRRAYTFGIIVRNLRPGDAPVVIGRFEVGSASTADNANSTTTTGKIAFKSKVVSRAHAEIWMDNGGSVMVRDTKSASGTFLNRTRLSQVDTESKWFPLADGDILQLGVDYQGGLEDAYKAVKIRVEIGREPETAFDTTALRALHALATTDSQPAPLSKASSEAGKPIIPDCCICLCAVSIRQALFTTPCSHTFHFKCIRPLLDAVPKTPMFTCPVCRTESNLDEEIEDHEPRRTSDSSVEQELLIDIEDRALPSLPPTPNIVAEVIQETEEEARSRPISRVLTPTLPSPDSPVGEGWRREMELMARDSQFIVALNNPEASVHPPEASPSIPIAHARAPSIPVSTPTVAPPRPVARAPSIGRARIPPSAPAERRLLSRAPSTGVRPSRGLPSNPAINRTHAATLPPGAALPVNPATHVSDVPSPPSRTPSPPPPPPSPLIPPPPPSPPALGGNWLREMELMQRHSQYIVSKPVTKEREKMRPPSDGSSTSGSTNTTSASNTSGTSLKRKGTWNRLLGLQNSNPPNGGF
ncbi:hypothetical protein BDZ89DRAFT_1068127 [Hymenopellis radicata]|nr:hypothetical protein BDZ89DRAFT_1068127 [Hymenopellis radicata]